MAKKQRRKSDRMASKGMPNPIDVHVGHRIRMRRTMMGLSQSTLGEALGLTFQQVQKYERGTNRVSSSRLFDLARIFKVQISFFFDEMGAAISKQSPGQLGGSAPGTIDQPADPAARRETLELVRAYYGIEEAGVRRRFTDLVRSIGRGDD